MNLISEHSGWLQPTTGVIEGPAKFYQISQKWLLHRILLHGVNELIKAEVV